MKNLRASHWLYDVKVNRMTEMKYVFMEKKDPNTFL